MPTRPSPLKAAAAASGITLAELAESIGYSRATLYQINTGRVAPWPELRRRLEVALGVDVFADDRGAA